MEFDVIEVIKDLGVPIALLVYFAYKDWKFTARIVELMTDIKRALHLAEERDVA